MKNCSIYQLTLKESDALKTYIDKHLAKGYICKSKSLMASPFFFVDKKDGKLRPVQDYRALNDITVKNAAPLPLIPKLIDKLHGTRYSPSWIFVEDTTISVSRKKMSIKLPSRHT